MRPLFVALLLIGALLVTTAAAAVTLDNERESKLSVAAPPCPEPENGPWPCSEALGKWVNGEPPSLDFFDVVDNGYCSRRGLLYEVWYALEGESIDDLLKSSYFPDRPSERVQVSRFDMPYDVADNYGGRVRGYIVAPVTGVYQFWLSSDREAVLLMGRGENVETAREVARVSQPTLRYDWLNAAEQRTPLMYLRAGEKVYVEALHKEAQGLDHLSVAWRLPGQPLTSEPEVIRPKYLCQFDRPQTAVASISRLPAGSVFGTGTFAWPVKGRITQYYNAKHRALDIAVPLGTQVHAADRGEVVFAGWQSCYGNLVILSHGNGSRTYYAHLNAILVDVGQAVQSGDVLAKSGSTGCSTGPHLHFEIRQGKKRLNPLDKLPR